MRTYRINCVDDADRIISTFDYFCIDDLDALDRANELCAENGVEVWDGARRVVWMYKGGEARLTNAHEFEQPPRKFQPCPREERRPSEPVKRREARDWLAFRYEPVHRRAVVGVAQ